MTQVLHKVLNLIKKTGDRCIVVSENSEDAYAVMSLDEYEKVALNRRDLTDLTEEQLLHRINRDIAVWKSQQEKATEAAEMVDRIEYKSAGNVMENNSNLANSSEITPDVDPWSNYEEELDESAEEDDEPYYFEKVS